MGENPPHRAKGKGIVKISIHRRKTFLLNIENIFFIYEDIQRKSTP